MITIKKQKTKKIIQRKYKKRRTNKNIKKNKIYRTQKKQKKGGMMTRSRSILDHSSDDNKINVINKKYIMPINKELDICPICREYIELGDVKVDCCHRPFSPAQNGLPAVEARNEGHFAHVDCIIPWCNRPGARPIPCPTCREPMTTICEGLQNQVQPPPVQQPPFQPPFQPPPVQVLPIPLEELLLMNENLDILDDDAVFQLALNRLARELYIRDRWPVRAEWPHFDLPRLAQYREAVAEEFIEDPGLIPDVVQNMRLYNLMDNPN